MTPEEIRTAIDAVAETFTRKHVSDAECSQAVATMIRLAGLAICDLHVAAGALNRIADALQARANGLAVGS